MLIFEQNYRTYLHIFLSLLLIAISTFNIELSNDPIISSTDNILINVLKYQLSDLLSVSQYELIVFHLNIINVNRIIHSTESKVFSITRNSNAIIILTSYIGRRRYLGLGIISQIDAMDVVAIRCHSYHFFTITHTYVIDSIINHECCIYLIKYPYFF